MSFVSCVAALHLFFALFPPGILVCPYNTIHDAPLHDAKPIQTLYEKYARSDVNGDKDLYLLNIHEDARRDQRPSRFRTLLYSCRSVGHRDTTCFFAPHWPCVRRSRSMVYLMLLSLVLSGI
ncbi:hypothetical protein L210DRAFT_3121393 [Boletus edulis BED1]|uniref:Secreted protein n=1 Tax=Boletus edulis BED1 TaxID=1328754 RepID=A0AAD4G7X3_BOLED|nr:hypothetical protein L210DRAFT_3121393 [Boletus edulis BED1]